jgi:hypothetical protein
VEQGSYWQQVRANLTNLGGEQIRTFVVEHDMTIMPAEMCLYDSICFLNQAELEKGEMQISYYQLLKSMNMEPDVIFQNILLRWAISM